MAQFIVNIPDAQVPRIREAFTKTYGYDPESGISATEFTRQQVIKFIKEVVKGYEVQKAAREAAEQAQAEQEPDIS